MHRWTSPGLARGLRVKLIHLAMLVQPVPSVNGISGSATCPHVVRICWSVPELSGTHHALREIIAHGPLSAVTASTCFTCAIMHVAQERSYVCRFCHRMHLRAGELVLEKLGMAPNMGIWM